MAKSKSNKVKDISVDEEILDNSKNTGTLELIIPGNKIRRARISIEGRSLITNRMSDKSIQDFEDIYVTKTKAKKKGSFVEARNPEEEWEGSLYPINKKKGLYGFPVSAIKECLVRAFDGSGIYMTTASKLFDVVPEHCLEGSQVPELFLIQYESIVQRRDRVRMNGRTPGLAYRCQFVNWSAEIEITFDEDLIGLQTLIPFITRAGFSVGIGCWTKGGHGKFDIINFEILKNKGKK